jgi:hypothetical protein
LHQWPNDGPDFVGRTSLVIDIYGMSSEKQFVNTLEDVIRKGERWTSSYRQRSRRNFKRVEILRALCIDDWQSEPNYQHQTLQNIVGKSSKEHTMVHELRNIPQTFGYLQVNGSQT